MNKLKKEVFTDLLTAAFLLLLGIAIGSTAVSAQAANKQDQIEALQANVDELKQRNATLQTETEAKQTLIDNLQWELENQPK